MKTKKDYEELSIQDLFYGYTYFKDQSNNYEKYKKEFSNKWIDNQQRLILAEVTFKNIQSHLEIGKRRKIKVNKSFIGERIQEYSLLKNKSEVEIYYQKLSDEISILKQDIKTYQRKYKTLETIFYKYQSKLYEIKLYFEKKFFDKVQYEKIISIMNEGNLFDYHLPDENEELKKAQKIIIQDIFNFAKTIDNRAAQIHYIETKLEGLKLPDFKLQKTRFEYIAKVLKISFENVKEANYRGRIDKENRFKS